jgi:hypothetical protein
MVCLILEFKQENGLSQKLGEKKWTFSFLKPNTQWPARLTGNQAHKKGPEQHR